MIDEMVRNGIVNKWRFLLNNYKSVGLSESELVLILLIMHFSTADKKFVTPNEIAQYSNFTAKEVDQIFGDLQKKQFIEIKSKKDKLEMDLWPLFIKIEVLVENNSTNYSQTLIIKKINEILTKKMTMNEVDAVNEIVAAGLSDYQLTIILQTIKPPITFAEFTKILKNKINDKPKTLTKFNWLTD